jgi:hypothetical protein
VARPSVDPTHVCLKAEPGETHAPAVFIAEAPSASEVTASIIPANPLMRILQLVAFRQVRRPFTEEEINELPPSPPSIREKARRNGTLETQEAGRRTVPHAPQIAEEMNNGEVIRPVRATAVLQSNAPSASVLERNTAGFVLAQLRPFNEEACKFVGPKFLV